MISVRIRGLPQALRPGHYKLLQFRLELVRLRRHRSGRRGRVRRGRGRRAVRLHRHPPAAAPPPPFQAQAPLQGRLLRPGHRPPAHGLRRDRPAHRLLLFRRRRDGVVWRR